jgi:hypothetical protein
MAVVFRDVGLGGPCVLLMLSLEDVPPGGQGLARYLAKYVVSPPISVRRIECYDGQTVRYWYRDHQTQAIQHETLPVLRFIGRMVQHILPKGFQRIRYHGLHSNVHYQPVRDQLDKLLPSGSPPDPKGYRVIPRKPFAQRVQHSFGDDALLCPRCGTTMELEYLYHPDWIEDIVVDAFPPDGPGRTPILICPNCHGTYLRDTSEPETQSHAKPE